MSFPRWLYAQRHRPDKVGELARHGADDPHFPWAGQAVDMLDHLRATSLQSGDLALELSLALDEWHGAPYPLHLDRTRRDAAKLERSRMIFKAAMDAELDRQRREESGREKKRGTT